jgi:arylsulfatase A-like enzyme
VTDQALSWLKSRDSDKPFFLWLHYMDPHGPYIPPEKYSTLFQDVHGPEPAPLEKLPMYQLQIKDGASDPISDLGFYRAQYDREVRYVDDEIGRLYEELTQMGVRDHTLFVLTADHGESFSEHEYYLEHGMLPYQACAHVPLIMVQPEVLPQGKVLEDPMGLIDLSATLVSLSGMEKPKTFEGKDLSPLILGSEVKKAPDFVFMESGYEPESTQLTVRHENWKLIQVRAQKDREIMVGSEYELYDVLKDPAESNNLAEQHPEVVKALSSVLEKWYLSRTLSIEGSKEFDLNSLDEGQLDMLRALGYVK